MWYALGRYILKQRIPLLVLLTVVTAASIFFAIKVKIGYEFSRAIPLDNQRYIDYTAFKKWFGEEGNTIAIGVQSNDYFKENIFRENAKLVEAIKHLPNIKEVNAVPTAVNLVNDSANSRLSAVKIFSPPYTQSRLDSQAALFYHLPLYKNILYTPTNCFIMGVTVDKDTLNSPGRTRLIASIIEPIAQYEKQTGLEAHISGLPYVRTIFGDRVKKEMNLFLTLSFVLSAITLFLFFRSIPSVLMSLAVVGIGVVNSLATIVLFDYRISLLSALIPVLIVVIGIPNCIYFLNKYHTAFRESERKQEALITMVGRMGIVTLLCNIAAAAGFAAFAFTGSTLLKEFGIVASINIMLLFVISLIFIPIVLSLMPPPRHNELKYLDSPLLERLLLYIEKTAFNSRAIIYGVTVVVLGASLGGMLKLRGEGFIVDDLPQKDKVFTDLKWFENNFGGVMPVEITIDTKKKKGLLRSNKVVQICQKIDSLSDYIYHSAGTAKPLSYVEGLKFAKQALFDGDSSAYSLPNESDLVFLSTYLRADTGAQNGPKKQNGFLRILSHFVDSNRQVARISVNIKDIGSAKLPALLKDFENKSNSLFDTAQYKITYTGTCVTFLEGSDFIIKGLRDSICWAFLFIALCLWLLFKDFKILFCSLIPNILPLMVTAGIMGWSGITLKPSTVLVFSVALGIAIDVTIRFLVNYKQELPHYNGSVKETLSKTIRHTGTSIIYTSLVLIAGFVIFCFSGFGGIFSLGWLTSLTLLVSLFANLWLLPVLILDLVGKDKPVKG